MENLKFSVSMSVYKNDNPEHFKTAVESILNQTVKPSEVVLVVDGPVSKELDEVIKSFEVNDFFKVIRLPENKGLGNALKVSCENASFDYIARMDADDISAPTRFEQQISYLQENPEVDVIGGDITEFINSPENIVGTRIVPKIDKEIKEYLKVRCPLNHVSVMIKKSALEKSGGYKDWFCNEDYYLWVRMLLCGCNFANTGTPLVNVRVGEEMYSRRGGLKYFKSEAGIQKLMLQEKIITYPTYLVNVMKRLVLQVLLPNSIRGWVFKKFARE